MLLVSPIHACVGRADAEAALEEMEAMRVADMQADGDQPESDGDDDGE